MENKFLNCFCLTLTIIGAVNWGLIGFFNFNLVALIFGSMSWISESSTHWSDFGSVSAQFLWNALLQ